ncbi:hypothetical protein MOD31_00385 [Paenarthrobacter sp. TYUT067]|uniref:hypothetical protein n=1 Tax=Paenarthrobacter sp. TYUT067 TaxID=2926245 RepID=UPI00202EF9FB|nr:hypothetical protein [Paenarthrobacter sp. TYUT067]MCM0614474.1 hypothetical protein [Paenarthrobacter sp. TYUT067]
MPTTRKEARRNLAAFPNHLEGRQVLPLVVLGVVTGAKAEAFVCEGTAAQISGRSWTSAGAVGSVDPPDRF